MHCASRSAGLVFDVVTNCWTLAAEISAFQVLIVVIEKCAIFLVFLGETRKTKNWNALCKKSLKTRKTFSWFGPTLGFDFGSRPLAPVIILVRRPITIPKEWWRISWWFPWRGSWWRERDSRLTHPCINPLEQRSPLKDQSKEFRSD